MLSDSEKQDIHDQTGAGHALICLVESALLAKLTAGVELPEPAFYTYEYFGVAECATRPEWDRYIADGNPADPNSPDDCLRSVEPLFTRDQLLAYGASQRLAGREQAIEEAKKVAHELGLTYGWKFAEAIRALAASPQEQT